MSAVLDHLIVSSRDLGRGIGHVESLLGVAVAPGGRHEGKGTINVLIGLGDGSYMEVLGADPDRPDPDHERWLGVDDAVDPILSSWCARATDLDEVIAIGARHGIDLGETSSGSRLKADGTLVSWTVTDPYAERLGGVVPFFIDWGDTPHPSGGLEHPCRCVDFVIRHPEADRLTAFYGELGLRVRVEPFDSPMLSATIDCPNGSVELR